MHAGKYNQMSKMKKDILIQTAGRIMFLVAVGGRCESDSNSLAQLSLRTAAPKIGHAGMIKRYFGRILLKCNKGVMLTVDSRIRILRGKALLPHRRLPESLFIDTCVQLTTTVLRM